MDCTAQKQDGRLLCALTKDEVSEFLEDGTES